MPPVSIPPSPVGCREELQNPPKLELEMHGGSLGHLLENMIGCLEFSGRRPIYRRRGDSRRRRRTPGGPQARPRVGPRLEGVWRLCPPPPGVLLAPSLFHLGNKSRKFSAHSEKLPRTTFLKQKDSRKQELALAILLIG